MLKTAAVWIFATMLALALAVSVQARGWEYLGNAHVDGNVDHDNIRVGRSAGPFRAVQLRVNGGAIDFERVVVHFENGRSEEILFRDRVPSGARTRPIDLPGNLRAIQSVELWYARGGWGHRPTVSLFGVR